MEQLSITCSKCVTQTTNCCCNLPNSSYCNILALQIPIPTHHPYTNQKQHCNRLFLTWDPQRQASIVEPRNFSEIAANSLIVPYNSDGWPLYPMMTKTIKLLQLNAWHYRRYLLPYLLPGWSVEPTGMECEYLTIYFQFNYILSP